MTVISSSPFIYCRLLHNFETFRKITSPYEGKKKYFLLLQIEGHKSSTVCTSLFSKAQWRSWTLDSGFELSTEMNQYHVFQLVSCDDSYLA